MIKRPNLKLKLGLAFLILTFLCSIIGQNDFSKSPNNEIIANNLSPQPSGYSVTEEWKWVNPYSATTDHMEISNDGEYIVAKFQNHPNATLFKKDSSAQIWTYESTSNLLDVAISGDGSSIVVSNSSHVIFLDNSAASPKEEIWKYPAVATSSPGWYVDISLDGNYIAAANGSHIFLLDKNGVLQWAYDTLDTIVDGTVAISGNGEYIIAGSSSNEYVYVFDTDDFNDSLLWVYVAGYPVKAGAISDDGSHLIIANTWNEVFFFNTTDFQNEPMWKYSAGEINTVRDLAISSNGNSSTISVDENLMYFNKTSSSGQKQPMWTFQASSDILALDMTMDGKYVIEGDNYLTTLNLLNNSITDPKVAEWNAAMSINEVAISGWGDYFVVSDSNDDISLFYHARPKPVSLSPLDDDDDDEDDDDKDDAIPEIPFGSSYLLFAGIAIVTLTLLYKRKIHTR